MEANDILDKFQEKIIEIYKEAENSLQRLSEKESKNYQDVTNMYECDESYLRNVARFAWAERAKKIAMIEMQSFLNKLRKQLEDQNK